MFVIFLIGSSVGLVVELFPELGNVATEVELGVEMEVGWCGYGNLCVHVDSLSVLWLEVVVVRLFIVNQRARAAIRRTLEADLLALWLGG